MMSECSGKVVVKKTCFGGLLVQRGVYRSVGLS
jgi:hypothetical protein